jgi:hypothetical protein
MTMLLRANGLHGLVRRNWGARLLWVPRPNARVTDRLEGRAGTNRQGGGCTVASGEARTANDATANGLDAVHGGGAAFPVGADDGRAAGEAAHAGLHVAVLAGGAVVAHTAGAVGSPSAAGAAAAAGFADGMTSIGGIVLREGAAMPEWVFLICDVGADGPARGGGGGLGNAHLRCHKFLRGGVGAAAAVQADRPL